MLDGPQLRPSRDRDQAGVWYLDAAEEERCRHRRFAFQERRHQEQGGGLMQIMNRVVWC